MASLHRKSPAGRYIHHDDSMDDQPSKVATLAVIDAAAPLLDLELDTVSRGSAGDIPVGHDCHETKAHHRGIRKAMFMVKDVVRKPFKALSKSEYCHYHTIHQNSGSSRAEPEIIVMQPRHANAPGSSCSSIQPVEESFTTKPKARTFSTTTKKFAKKAGPALLALVIGIAEHYFNNASS